MPRNARNNAPYNEDFPPEEETTEKYTVDWDAEWRKVVQNGGTTTKKKIKLERPGSDFYKSEAEIAAIRAANAATEQVNKVVVSIPTFDELKKDWRFWIGVLAVLSVGSSLLGGLGMSQQMPTNASPDSYYI